MVNEKVILVDEQDKPIGEMDKLEAHQKGALHRAFSVFLFNNSGQLLLQQRSKNKYHSPGLWTNTCCSHPLPNEDTLQAAKRRLREEMGIGARELEFKGHLIYKTNRVAIGFENGLIEHEYDHIFTGKTEEEPKINTDEVENFLWASVKDVKARMRANPEQYTYWFKVAMDRFF
jgi:isopentenyl-diphosphate Delta-isomerase